MVSRPLSSRCVKRRPERQNKHPLNPMERIMNLLRRIICVAAVYTFIVTSGFAQELLAGRDYTVINPPQPTNSGKKIEVLEFFWYGSIDCYHLEAPLKTWLKRKPSDVAFRYAPTVFDVTSW